MCVKYNLFSALFVRSLLRTVKPLNKRALERYMVSAEQPMLNTRFRITLNVEVVKVKQVGINQRPCLMQIFPKSAMIIMLEVI